MDLGRKPVARLPDGDVVLSDAGITAEELEEAVEKVSLLLLIENLTFDRLKEQKTLVSLGKSGKTCIRRSSLLACSLRVFGSYLTTAFLYDDHTHIYCIELGWN